VTDRDGELRIIEYSVAPFSVAKISGDHAEDATQAVFVCVMMRDVTERELAQERMRFLALHDSLTGLHNRAALEQQLELWLATEAAGELALLYFDLDRFKAVNDALGHAVGDKVLIETAQRATQTLPAFAFVARVGGDEFSAVLPGCSLEAAHLWAEALAVAVARPFEVGGHTIHAGASIGISACSKRGETASAVMRQADIALYSAKRSGTGRVVTFEPFMDDARLARLELERDLAAAIENKEFEVVYQPQLGLRSGELVGVEALLRWRRPDGGIVSPARFIPVAEEMGLIHRLGAWVLATACRDAVGWPLPVKVAVNISPVQFETGDLVEAVRQALRSSQLPAERLELEITESTFMRESRRLAESFGRLLEIGVKFSLDDFGTGYSSLAYLHRYPISKIKIDRSFVTGVPADTHSMAILRSVMALAEGLGIRTIAEGIETSEQAEVLRMLGCDDGQGYLFSRPISRADVELLLRRELAGKECSQAA
jgi:diguanylate cyclase (GGDEF)-like protein